ncbi:MAG TPA: FG-GAP-like repeat-containing protein, partial [Nitrospiraceae bacterium]
MTRLSRRIALSVFLLVRTTFAEAATAQLSWDANPEPGIAGYIVSVGTSSGIYSTNINVGSDTTYLVTDLDPDRTYYFAVRAYDSLGQTSPYSSEVIRAARAPLTPDFGTGANGPQGTPDLIWQHDDGLLGVWYMNGTIAIDAAPLNPSAVSDPNWRIVGTGDFDRDNKIDLLWHHKTSGAIGIWLLDGLNYRGGAPVDRVSDTNWKIAAVGDLNGDSSPDLVWQHQTLGYLSVWYMQGTSPIGYVPMSAGSVPISFSIVGTGDLNADGHTDLVWQHQDGWLSVWFMNGVTITSAQNLNPNFIDPSWKVVSVSDFNFDGRPDLIFQRDDGYLGAWFLNGPNLVGTQSL